MLVLVNCNNNTRMFEKELHHDIWKIQLSCLASFYMLCANFLRDLPCSDCTG